MAVNGHFILYKYKKKKENKLMLYIMKTPPSFLLGICATLWVPVYCD